MNDSIIETKRLFADVVGHRNDELDLALAALLIAKAEYPDLNPEEQIERLNHLAVEVDENVDLTGSVRRACEQLCSYLAQRLGFRGDDENHYDARNNYLNDVLDRHRGSSAALAVLYIEVGRRLGIEMRPVVFPAHLLLRVATKSREDVFIDPYDSGRVLDLEGCRDLLHTLYGDTRAFRESLVAPGTRRQVVARLLQDLRFVYLQENRLGKAVRTLELLVALTPWDLEQIRERGFLYARAGNKEAAIADLNAYLQNAPPGASLQPVKDALRRLLRVPPAPAEAPEDIDGDDADDH